MADERDHTDAPLPPHNLEAEAALLGAILATPDVVMPACAALKPEHFIGDTHRELYSACRTLADRAAAIDPFTISGLIGADGLERIGGHAYLAKLVSGSGVPANAQYYAEAIIGLAHKRELFQIGQDLNNGLLTGDTPTPELVAGLKARLREIEEGERPPLEFLNAASLAGQPVPVQQWIVPVLVPCDVTTLFSGHGGMGKTTLIVQLLIAAALGDYWLGRQLEAVRAVGIFAEDQTKSIERLFIRIAEALGVDLAGLEAIDYVPADKLSDVLAGVSMRNSNKVLATPEFHRLRERVLDTGTRLLTIDPAANVFDGDENVRNQVRQFISMLNKLAAEMEGAVLLSSHPSQSGLRMDTGYSGSTAWHNSVRSLINLTTPKADDHEEETDKRLRVLRHLKCNVGPLADDLSLYWTEGVYAPDSPPTGTVAAAEARNVEKDFLAALDRANKAGKRVSDSRQGHYAPRELRPFLPAKQWTVRDMERAMNRLMGAAQIELVSYGKPSNHAKMFVRAATNEQASLGV